MKIIIAGYGFVGKAVAGAFEVKHDIVIVDPNYTTNEIKYHPDAEGVIICVPTPYTVNGGCDITHIKEVLDVTPIHLPVLIKSTVSPNMVEELEKLYPDHWIVYSPEFLRAKSANQDFLNQRHVIIGGEDPDAYWQTIFQATLPNCNLVFNCTAKEASLVKYSINSFLALKTGFFNQIYDICEEGGMDFAVVRQLITQDQRIGGDHSMVPGPDGQRGWGGHCFPKDTQTLLKYTYGLNKPITILGEAIEYNKTVRKDLDI
jgi:nucleotide sugar dehydrogenase